MRSSRVIFSALFLTATCSLAQAGTITFDTWWTGAAGDKLWSTAGNWNTGVVPNTVNKNVLFDGDGATDCIVDGSFLMKSLYIDKIPGSPGSYTHTLTVAVGSILTVGQNFTCSGTMIVDGTLILKSSALSAVHTDADGTGHMTFNAGAVLNLNNQALFNTPPDTYLTMAGTAGNPVIVAATGGLGALGDFSFTGNVSLSYVEFYNLNNDGLQLLSDSGQAVSASNISFRSSSATLTDSQYLLVTGTAWNNYVFDGFSFEDGPLTTDPTYTVESSQNITFRHYMTGPGYMYDDPTTDPASTGTVVWEKADLIITSINPSNANPTVGDIITVSVTVKNQGSLPAGRFAVELFYNRGTPPAVGATGDQRQTVTSLAPGASTVVTFSGITSGVAGTWNTYSIVDNLNTVVESLENNNVAGPTQIVWAAAGIKPDLVIQSITPSNGTPTAGTNISVDVVVRNNGTGAAGSFRVDLFYNRGTAPVVGDTGDQNALVAGLGVGAQTTVTFTSITNPVPATWSMYAIVDTLNAVGESNETNNVAGPQAVQWRGIDLTITDITPSNSSPVIGATISVTVTVKNNGNIASGAFNVGLFYNKSPAPTPGTAADATQNVVTLAAGASTVLTFNGITTLTAGIWDMYAIADNGTAVSEYDETNNVGGPKNVTWRAPDLVILSITPSNSNPTILTNITVDVVVKNQGNADAGAFTVGLIYDSVSAPVPGAAADQTKNVASLTVGSQTTLTFTGVTNGTAVTWQMYAIADNKVSPGDVRESDETNNVGGPVSVAWTTAGTQPDLTILSVVPSNANPAIGELITVDVTVKNQGNAASGSFDVGLCYNKAAPPAVGTTADKTLTVASLAIGAQTVLTFTNVTSAATGVWSMYAIADNKTPPGDITESNENNNVSTAATVTWHAPDLVILSVAPTNADPDIGGTISVNVTVKNNGDAPAGAFDVGLFYNKASAPAVGDPANQTQAVASLAIGASTIVTFTGITSAVTGAWQMYAIVDNGQGVSESNEANNVNGPTAVTWHGPDLVVTAVTPSTTTPSTADTISVNVTVRNLGDRAVGAFQVALFKNRATSPSVGEAGDYSQNVASLVAGGMTTLTFNGITNAVAEVWKMWAIADNGSAILEGNESNNITGPVTVTWGTPSLPDLIVVSVVPSNNSPTTGSTISVDVTIQNNGTAAASMFNVGLYYNLATAPIVGTPADQSKTVTTLAGGGAQQVLTFTGISNLTAEVWSMYAYVDSTGVTTESNENNNSKGPVTVNWGAVTGITVLVPNGGEVWEASTAQQITWRTDGDTGVSTVSIDYSLDNGATWLPVTASTPDDGVFDWDIPVADSTLCLVKVSSEGGSYSDVSDDTFTITPAGVGKPNLKIISVAPSNSVPNTGSTISVDVTVRNIGTAAAGMFYVDLFFNCSSPPVVGDTGDRSQSTVSLAPGSEANVVFTGISSAVAGAWNMYAIVDTQKYVTESNEGDNVSGPVQVGWSTLVESFRLVAPNGFEVLEQGSSFDITWTWTGAVGATVDLELSTNGGATWTEVSTGVANSGTYTWTVPNVSSADCRVRITNSTATVYDVSDDVFTIQKAHLAYFGGGCSGTTKNPAGGASDAAGLLLVIAGFVLATAVMRNSRRRSPNSI